MERSFWCVTILPAPTQCLIHGLVLGIPHPAVDTRDVALYQVGYYHKLRHLPCLTSCTAIP